MASKPVLPTHVTSRYRSSFYLSAFGYRPQGASPELEGTSDEHAAAEVQRMLMSTTDKLLDGQQRHECLAPLSHVGGKELCRQHAAALGELLQPLWNSQKENIKEILRRVGDL